MPTTTSDLAMVAPAVVSVRVEPSGIRFVMPRGERLMFGALSAGYAWPTLCGGDGTCTICAVEVLQDDHVSPVDRDELRALEGMPGRRFYRDPLRLACRVRVLGDLVVRKRGVRRHEQTDNQQGRQDHRSVVQDKERPPT